MDSLDTPYTALVAVIQTSFSKSSQGMEQRASSVSRLAVIGLELGGIRQTLRLPDKQGRKRK